MENISQIQRALSLEVKKLCEHLGLTEVDDVDVLSMTMTNALGKISNNYRESAQYHGFDAMKIHNS